MKTHLTLPGSARYLVVLPWFFNVGTVIVVDDDFSHRHWRVHQIVWRKVILIRIHVKGFTKATYRMINLNIQFWL